MIMSTPSMSPRPSERRARHDAILQLLRRGGIRNQTELAETLANEGIEVNQATLSRDLRELGVLKGPAGWMLPGGEPAVDELTRACREWLQGAEAVQNLLVLKSSPGGATPLALALDHSDDRGVAGTIAGDDTVLAVCADATKARTLARKLMTLKEGHG